MEFHNEFIRKIKGTSTEEKVAKEIAIFLANKYHARINPFIFENNSYLIISNNKFNIAITICDTDKHKVIKIEELLVEENFRGRGLGTEILKDVMKVAKDNNCIVGLWCLKDNIKGNEFYKKIGFKHVDTINDNWYEY